MSKRVAMIPCAIQGKQFIVHYSLRVCEFDGKDFSVEYARIVTSECEVMTIAHDTTSMKITRRLWRFLGKDL